MCCQEKLMAIDLTITFAIFCIIFSKKIMTLVIVLYQAYLRDVHYAGESCDKLGHKVCLNA